ncbi:MAG: nucleotidyltransferase domain-containing protein [Spirochaetales bacterium]|nr:nucleotidyltransferase domain-containing protein [Spirochaetales bacterium]
MDDLALQAAVDKIKTQYSQAKILLFGSWAKNTNKPDSDVDLCVILENPEQRPIEISRKIRKEIYPILNSPLDILVYDKKTFDERSSFPLTMEAEIIEYAREL